jgi:hypothetical protein
MRALLLLLACRAPLAVEPVAVEEPLAADERAFLERMSQGDRERREVLRRLSRLDPSSLTVLALSPKKIATGRSLSFGEFHGYPVVSSVAVNNDATALITGLRRAILDGDEEKLCFLPHHGLRIGDLDVVICFLCSTVRIYDRDGEWHAPITPSLKPLLDQQLRPSLPASRAGAQKRTAGARGLVQQPSNFSAPKPKSPL